MKRVARLCLLGILISGFASGQQPSGAPETGTLEGKVINAQNGRAVPRATVVLRNLKKVSARSVRADGQGHFIARNVDPGPYRLSAEHASYFSGSRHQVFSYRVDLGPGEQQGNIVLSLQPAAVVTGQITDENSEPLENVQIGLFSRTYRGGRMMLEAVGGAVSDDRGIYRIFDVRPGTYTLAAEVQPAAQASSNPGSTQSQDAPPESDIAYQSAFYPQTTDLLQSHTLAIRGGDETHADFVFVSRPSVSIRGRVVNGVTGNVEPNANVTVLWTEYLENTGSIAKTGGNGRFEVRGLAPGTYTLRAAFARDGIAYTAQSRVEVGSGGLENVTLEAVPDTAINGHVHVELDEQTLRSPQRVQIEFQSNTSPAHASAAAGRPPGSAAASHDLAFSTRLRPGDEYTITARGLPQNFYLKSVRVNGERLDPAKVSVSDQSADVDLVISSSGGYVEGLVIDDSGNPYAAASVVLIPEESRRDDASLFRSASSDKNGHFQIRGVPPGNYELLAFDDVDLNELIAQPDILQRFEGRAVNFTVEEQTDYNTALKIIRGIEEVGAPAQ